MKIILYSTLTLSLLLVGCGEISSQKEESLQTAHKSLTKVNRYDWDEVDKPNVSKLGTLTKVLNGNYLEIYLEKGSKVGSHMQFFIDSDLNEATGYHSDKVDGADYLVEDGRIYKAKTDGYDWNWERLGHTTFSNQDTFVSSYISTRIIQNPNKNFRVAAVSSDASWQTVSKIKMKPMDRGIVSVDASVEEWKNTPILAKNDDVYIKTIDDSKTLYMMIQSKKFSHHQQIFINGNNEDNAEYLIEDDRLYKSNHDGSSWPYDRIGFVEYAKNGKIVELAVLKSKLNLSPQDHVLKVGAVGWDKNYDNRIYKLNDKQAPLENQEGIVISEVMASNAHTKLDPDFSKFSDWIELHNKSANDIDISNYKLSDKLDKGKWTIPQNTTIKAGEYMLFWADDENRVAKGYHTNFTLKSKGESIALFDNQNKLVDGFKFGKQQADITVSNQNNELRYMNPTPNAKNSPSVSSLSLTSEPNFSINGGFYGAGFSLDLSANGSTIYYTTDGSYPTKKSPVYRNSISINDTTIVRARALEDGKLLSKEVTNSYFIGVNKNLAVVSISTDDDYLFGDRVGIYTIGTNGAKTPGCSDGPQFANFYQNWKRPAHIEYFDKDKKLGFSQEVDIKISGSCSRVIPQKSLSISAKSKYGKKSIDYKLFPHKNISKFAGFKLKSGGQDWYGTMLRDAFMQQVIKDDMDVDYQDYRPCVVYLNGKYWGIHNIREKKNEHFLAENHSAIDPKKIDILKSHNGIKEGNDKKYKEFLAFIDNHDLSDATNYNTISTMMDMENYIDYIIAETYFANADWPYENVRYYRPQKDGALWRWMLEDLDLALGGYGSDVNNFMLDFISNPNSAGENNPLWSTQIFRALIKNPTFKARFKQKYYGYLNSTFSTNRMIIVLDNLASVIREEIPSHEDRWKIDGWEEKINDLKDIIRNRNTTIRSELWAF